MRSKAGAASPAGRTGFRSSIFGQMNADIQHKERVFGIR